MKTFAALAHGRDNNFQLLRIVAAAAVIVSHSFPIALGSTAYEPRLFGTTLGGIAVWTFFSLSGFLVYKSFEHRPAAAFVEARALRIYPALVVVTFLSVLVLGPLVTAEPLPAYFSARETLEYIPRALSLKFVSFALSGVFSSNPYPAVNGPLWTLYYEVACYIGLAAGLTLLRSFRLFLVVYAALLYLLRQTLYADLSLAFVAGMAVYRYREAMPARWQLAMLALGLAAVVPAAAPVSIGYTALWLAQVKSPLLAYNRVGDYSYGLYIYGWPMQELAAYAFPGVSPLGVMAAAFPAALGAAMLSWYLVEKPALALKGWATSGQRPTVTVPAPASSPARGRD